MCLVGCVGFFCVVSRSWFCNYCDVVWHGMRKNSIPTYKRVGKFVASLAMVVEERKFFCALLLNRPEKQ